MAVIAVQRTPSSVSNYGWGVRTDVTGNRRENSAQTPKAQRGRCVAERIGGRVCKKAHSPDNPLALAFLRRLQSDMGQCVSAACTRARGMDVSLLVRLP
jgi:hypothetical protein